MQQSSSTNVKLNDLSVVGREIINSSVKSTKPGSGNHRPPLSDTQSARDSTDGPLSNSTKARTNKTLTQGGLPIDASNGLVFGFLEEDLVDALNENNQWKDRTNAMEEIEAQIM